ncbi:MAG: flagellar basal body rod protein FlgB [Aquificae bacterium]|nr:flagellar basal body rod protein FlgB [Aquificota bacterium]
MKLFEGAQRILPYLRYAWTRHKALLSNVANADTPNYVRRDVRFELKKPELILKTTHEKHITNLPSPRPEVYEDRRTPFGNDNNNVRVEMEIANLVKNKLAYEVYLKFATGSLDTLNKVIKGRAE